MGDFLFETNWYKHPIDSQKRVHFMIYAMQKPIFYKGFDITILDLETFTKVTFKF